MAAPRFRPHLALGGVPLHAMVVPFPIVCFIGAFLTDLAYLNSGGQVQWANFSQWLLAFGELMGAIAALLGLVDLFSRRRAARPNSAYFYFGGCALVLTLGLFNNFVHARDGWTGVVPTGLTLSVFTVLVLIPTEFFGYRLAHVDARERAG